jgi:glycosyltransferase involved in cell wall biosynthesis
MRIFILQRFDLSSVSCARRVLCQAEELLHRGHEVHITDFVHEERHKEVPQVANLSSLGAHLIPLNRKILSLYANCNKILTLGIKPDIVHLWKSYPDASLLAYYLSKKWHIPLHYDWDDWEQGIAQELTNSKAVGWMAGRWDRLFPSLCHSMTVASDFLRKKALEYGTPADKMRDAPVGADLSMFYPREKDQALLKELGLSAPILAYSGQLEVASYAELTIDTLINVQRKYPTASLLILGGGRKLESIREKTTRLKLDQSVHCTDYVPSHEIPRFLSLADVALAPFEVNDVTRAKSPLKIAEYIAMGIPVVATDVGEAKKMIGHTGLVAPPGDSERFSECVIALLNQNRPQGIVPEQTKAMYNWKSHVDELEKAYQYALSTFR